MATSTGWVWSVLLLLTVAVCGVSGKAGAAPTAREGSLDLSEWDFSHSGIVALSGEWQFYWHALYTPQQLHDRRPQTTGLIELPSPWNGYVVGGEKLSGSGYATYRLVVTLPHTDEPLALRMPNTGTAHTLWANGKRVASNGVVGTDRASMTPRDRIDVVRLGTPGAGRPPGDGSDPADGSANQEGNRLELVVQVSNFNHRRGGMWKPVLLGTERQITVRQEQRGALDMLLFGSALIIGLYHLAMFLLYPRERSTLYFAGFCLLLALRTLLVGEIMLTRLAPSFNWTLQLRLEYLSGYLAMPLLFWFIHSLYPEEMSPRFCRGAMGIGLLFSLIVVTTPVRVFSYTLLAYQIFLLAGSIYGMYALILALRRDRSGARVFVGGAAVALLFFVNDTLYYNNVVSTTDLSPVAAFVMILGQAAAVADKYASTFRRQRRLTDENSRLLATVQEQLDELKRSRRMLSERDDGVRKEIAERLHGRVQTRLELVWHQLEKSRHLIGTDPDKADEVLRTVQDELDELRERDVRQVSRLLHPSIIGMGLIPAIRSLVREFANTLEVRLLVGDSVSAYDGPLDNRIPESLRLNVFRVLEEALNNVRRHAEADEVRVEVALEGTECPELVVSVQDDGIGFDPQRVPRGLGLEVIRARVMEQGGTWNLSSQPGAGTCVTLRWPLDQVGDESSGKLREEPSA